MRFFTAAVLALSFFAGAAIAQDVGEPCPADQAGDVGCAATPSVNGGNSYIFICNGQDPISSFAPPDAGSSSSTAYETRALHRTTVPLRSDDEEIDEVPIETPVKGKIKKKVKAV
ncbi:hypothetical protein B0H19DRAFT_1258486 [Mycena capillaripes]|nr:hypothetical protein B0H19DRAFT_1258486 [Mycena capillaripes]